MVRRMIAAGSAAVLLTIATGGVACAVGIGVVGPSVGIQRPSIPTLADAQSAVAGVVQVPVPPPADHAGVVDPLRVFAGAPDTPRDGVSVTAYAAFENLVGSPAAVRADAADASSGDGVDGRVPGFGSAEFMRIVTF